MSEDKAKKSESKGEVQVDQSAADRLDPNVNVQEAQVSPFAPQTKEGQPTIEESQEAARLKNEHYQKIQDEEAEKREAENPSTAKVPPAAIPLDQQVSRSHLDPTQDSALSPEAAKQRKEAAQKNSR